MYRIVIPKKEQKDLSKIDVRYKNRIERTIGLLVDKPLSGKKISGLHKHRYTIRVWPYRIVYEVDKRRKIVLIIRIGHRQGVYK